MHTALNLWPYGYLDVNCLKKTLIINPLTLDLNSWHNVLNPRFKSHAHTHTHRENRKKERTKERKKSRTKWENSQHSCTRMAV